MFGFLLSVQVVFGLSLLLLLPSNVEAILPTAQINVRSSSSTDKSTLLTLLASEASFGPLSSMTNQDYFSLVLPPADNPLLCENTISATSKSAVYDKNSIMVVPRGECTYEFKTWVAQTVYGISGGVIIYNTLASRYSMNATKHKNEKYPTYSTNDIIWPVEYYDYDCQKGSAMVPTVDLSLQPLPYNALHNDPLLSSSTTTSTASNNKRNKKKEDNLCKLYSKDDLRNCASQKCLITSNYTTNSTFTQVCCAWDLHLWLFADAEMKNITAGSPISIPTVFVTIQQGMDLLELIENNNNNNNALQACVQSRWRSNYNISSVLIWMLGVFVAALAAYRSANDYHEAIHQRKKLSASNEGGSRPRNNTNNTGHTAPQPRPSQEETLELEPIHAVAFVVMASASLLFLFYFKTYNLVKVMYAIGCSNAVVQVVVQPLVYKLLKKMGCSQKLWFRSADLGNVTNWDVLAVLLGYAWGMIWLYMALFVPHPDEHTFFWVTQDVLGACMCIVFLGLIQLNSIQVASILLIVAFVYDIFFVFVTPYIFQKSIMITVATSGGPPKADPLWCEKYPQDKDCAGGDPLPMLLTVPRLLDYQGGSSLLGLGDIVLPGLLLSFAARLDAAKSLVAIVSGGRQSGGAGAVQCSESNWCGCGYGSYYYFFPLVIAYAVGLCMANVAVYVMNMGQPALLYLVPCTLGTMSYLGWKRQELRALWEGPRVIATADQIVYGRAQSSSSSPVDPASVPQGGDADAQQQPLHGDEEEFVDDEAGDLPLLSTSGTSSTNKNTQPIE